MIKVLITGASSGLGKSFGKYFGEMGCKLYVVSRNKKELSKIYKNIRPKVTILEYDLSVLENCYELHRKLKKENIDILINNAGFGDCGQFNKTSLKKELNMIDLNIKSYHILTKLFLKDFMKRNRGRILNVASIAGFMPGTYMATYYATKSYIVNLTLAISEELRQDGSKVKVSVFCPGPLNTNFLKVANVKFSIPLLSPDYAAEYAVDKMFKDKVVIIPPNMKLDYYLIKLAPLAVTLLVNSNIQKRVIFN